MCLISYSSLIHALTLPGQRWLLNKASHSTKLNTHTHIFLLPWHPRRNSNSTEMNVGQKTSSLDFFLVKIHKPLSWKPKHTFHSWWLILADAPQVKLRRYQAEKSQCCDKDKFVGGLWGVKSGAYSVRTRQKLTRRTLSDKNDIQNAHVKISSGLNV